jgi:hypothetical protein
MSDWLNGVKVPPLKIALIRELTNNIRTSFGIAPEDPFPVGWFLETAMPQGLKGFDWEVDDTLPRHVEACAFPDGCRENPDGPYIKVRPEVYDAACAGDGRARLTLLHECGHVLLHRQVAVHPRKEVDVATELRPYENSEWQANTFAAELLMPPQSFKAATALPEFCRRMGVSYAAARTQGIKLIRRNEIPAHHWLVA